VIVLTGAGPTALTNRMRTVGQLPREFWAGTEHADYGYGATAPDDGDFYLDFTAKVSLVITTLDRLQQHGPMGPARTAAPGAHRHPHRSRVPPAPRGSRAASAG
jgi:hypothetical protein